MSSNKSCLNCGCTSFVSDRSLGGKLVCLKCGSSRFKVKSFSKINNKFVYVVIGIIVFCIIII